MLFAFVYNFQSKENRNIVQGHSLSYCERILTVSLRTVILTKHILRSNDKSVFIPLYTIRIRRVRIKVLNMVIDLSLNILYFGFKSSKMNN